MAVIPKPNGPSARLEGSFRLPDGLAAECPCPAHVPALRHPALPRPAPPLTDCVRQPRGLRAPPALV